MDKLKIKLYRHKVYKDIYLKRNWNIVGGCSDTEWWSATNDLFEAIANVKTYAHGKWIIKNIEEEYHSMYFENGHSKLKAKITLEKEFDFDGFKGKLKKELVLPLDDFELVTLIESEDKQ